VDAPFGHPWFGQAFPCICTKEKAAGRYREWLRSLSGLTARQRRLTFATFDERVQPEAHGAVWAWATGNAPQPWLVLLGGTGTGKTHLAAAATLCLIDRDIRATYVYLPDILNQLRAGFSDGTFNEQWESLRSTPALILDDLMEAPSKWAAEQLTALLDYRLRGEALTMLCMNLSLSELPERIRSRLQDREICRVVIMRPHDYRLTKQPTERSA
jgi:DNA replication protein DnaC